MELNSQGKTTLTRRERQRANRRIKRKEESLDRKTVGGISDPTPFHAIERIKDEDKGANRK